MAKPKGTIATLTTMEVFVRDLYSSVASRDCKVGNVPLDLRFGHGSRTVALECVPGCRGLGCSQVPRVTENI